MAKLPPSRDPIVQAKREWNRLKAARRNHPDQVTADQVSGARRAYMDLLGRPAQGDPTPVTLAIAHGEPPPPPEVKGYATDPADAERAGRLEILLLVKYGLPRGEDLEFDEDAEREWLHQHPAVRARVMSWLARRALADLLRTPPGPAGEEAAAN